jgi:TPR repeat protein
MLSHDISLQVLRDASGRGIAHASWLLSQLYRSGLGVCVSPENSQACLSLAIEQGSLRARRDLAFKVLSGNSTATTPEVALDMLGALVDAGFSRTEIGEKLLFSRNPALVEKGFQALKLESLQDFNWKARWLVALCKAFNKNIPEADADRLIALKWLDECGNNPDARHALALGSLLGQNSTTLNHEELVKNFLEIGTAEAAIDALQLLFLPSYADVNEELRGRAFLQVAAHAEAGHVFAQVTHLFTLLLHAHSRDEGDCAVQLLQLLKQHPEMHTPYHDYPIHRAKEKHPEVVSIHLETMKVVASSSLAPYSKRTLFVELSNAGLEDEAEVLLKHAVNLGIENSVGSMARSVSRKYRKTGEGLADVRFWMEAFVFENPEEGHQAMYDFLESSKEKSKLSHDDVLTQRNCLEFLSRRKNDVAMRELGLMLLRGEGPVLADSRRGLKLLEEAAKTDGRAMYELAHVHQAGVHVPRDMYLAQYYFDEAAKNGHSNAQYDDFKFRKEREEKEAENTSGVAEATVTPLVVETDAP